MKITLSMNKANEILKNIELIESLLDLMKKASKAIMEVYEKPIAR